MKCQRSGCDQQVPRNRRKYCSDQCRYKAMVERRARSRKRRINVGPNGRGSQVKPRTCLGCGVEFLSEGPWNRLCDSCAHRNASIRCRRCSVPSEWPEAIRMELNHTV